MSFTATRGESHLLILAEIWNAKNFHVSVLQMALNHVYNGVENMQAVNASEAEFIFKLHLHMLK